MRLHSPPTKCSEQILWVLGVQGFPPGSILFTAAIHFSLCSGSLVGKVKNLTPFSWHRVFALLFVQPKTQQDCVIFWLRDRRQSRTTLLSVVRRPLSHQRHSLLFQSHPASLVKGRSNNLLAVAILHSGLASSQLYSIVCVVLVIILGSQNN